MAQIGKSIVGVGIQYGDEGKIKIFDRFFKEMGAVVRYNGATNAGGTLKVGNKEIVLHGMPGAVHHKKVIQYLGSGALLNPIKMTGEIENANKIGANLENRLKFSSKVSLIQPHHILLDKIMGGKIGTTGNGIGPGYSDQALRQLGNQLKNVRFGDFLSNPEEYRTHVENNLQEVVDNHKMKNINVMDEVNKFVEETKKLERYLCQDPLFLEKIIQSGKNIFFQGVNSTMLDLITGDVPFVTSSRTLASAAYTGEDLSLKYHAKTIAVGKAIMSRVGNGPFISEFGGEKSELYCGEEGGYKHIFGVEESMYDSAKLLTSSDPFEMGIGLRMLGGEYGATTKRPRRIGRLDFVLLKQQCILNGVDELYLNKFDCLNQFAETNLPGIPVVTAYKLDGNTIDYYPSTIKEARRAEPVIDYLPHIREDISNVRDYKDLPSSVIEGIKIIESHTGVHLFGIGVGPKRKDFVSTDPNKYSRN